MKKLTQIIFIILVIAFLLTQGQANQNEARAQTSSQSQTITLPVVEDTYIANGHPNYGSRDHFEVYGDWTVLMKFDLSSIPKTAKISKTTLSFYVNGHEGHNAQSNPFIIPVATDWKEMEATWYNATATTPWPRPGAREFDKWTFDYLDKQLDYNQLNQWYSGDITLLVQSWVSGIFPNYGLAIVPFTSTYTIFNVASKEYASGQFAPKVDITYTDTGVLSLPDSSIPAEITAQADSHILTGRVFAADMTFDDFQESGGRYFLLSAFPLGDPNTSSWIDKAAARGLKVVLSVGYYTPDYTDDQMRALGVQLAQTYGSKVAIYEVSGEFNGAWYESIENGTPDYKWSPETITGKVHAFYEGVRSIDPNARISFASLGAKDPLDYLQECLKYGLANWTDMWGTGQVFDPYKPNTGDYIPREISLRGQWAKWAFAEGQRADPPHPITYQEEGMMDLRYLPDVTRVQQAKAILWKTLFNHYAGALPNEWFKMYADDPDVPSYGLITAQMNVPPYEPDGTSPPDPDRIKHEGFYAIKYLNKYLDPGKYAPINLGMTSTGDVGLLKLAFKASDNDLALAILNVNNGTSPTLDPGVTTDITIVDYGLIPAKIVDPLTGSVQDIPPAGYSTADGKLTIKNIEVVDYPRIITLSKDAPLLELKKSVDKTSASSGETLTYTISFSNTGTQEAINAKLEDVIPSGTTYVANSASNGGQYDEVNKKVIWNLGNIASGTSGSIQLQVRVE